MLGRLELILLLPHLQQRLLQQLEEQHQVALLPSITVHYLLVLQLLYQLLVLDLTQLEFPVDMSTTMERLLDPATVDQDQEQDQVQDHLSLFYQK